MFPVLDPEKMLEEQRAEFYPCIDEVKEPVTLSVPDGETKNNMSHNCLIENIIFRWYFAGYVNNCRSVRDQVVVLTALRKFFDPPVMIYRDLEAILFL